jgi:arabinofuranosyltransferase
MKPTRWLTAILLLYLAHAAYLSGIAEDAYITFRFARNLVHGYGLTWNAGETPVEGYTSVLWVLVSALAMRLGLDAPRAAQIIGLAAGAATILLAYWAGRRLAGWPVEVALVPPLMLAVAGPFAAWATSGMETVPFALLVLAGLFGFAAYWRSFRRRTLLATSFTLLLATLTRPEGVLVFGVVIVLGSLSAIGDSRSHTRNALLAAAVYVVPLAVYLAWRLGYYGYWLPNSFYAKTGGGVYQVLRGGVLTAGFGVQFVAPLVPWGLLAMWENGAPRLAVPGIRRAAEMVRAHALVTACTALSLAYGVYVVAIGGDYMAMHRFFVPVLAPLYCAGAAWLAVLGRSLARPGRRPAFAVIVAATAAATAFHSMPFDERFFARPAQQHGNYRGIQVERWSVARLTLIGRFFDSYRKSPGESLATDAIGAIGYFTDMPVYDYLGLVDTHIAHLPIARNQERGMPGHQKADFPYIVAKRPTYLMFSRFLTPAPAPVRDFVPPEILAVVEAEYEPRSVWLQDTVNRESGYFTFLERRARCQSYTLGNGGALDQGARDGQDLLLNGRAVRAVWGPQRVMP